MTRARGQMFDVLGQALSQVGEGSAIRKLALQYTVEDITSILKVFTSPARLRRTTDSEAADLLAILRDIHIGTICALAGNTDAYIKAMTQPTPSKAKRRKK